MHLRGTHCGRSDGKNQISRAQSRWNNGMADHKGEELSDDKTTADNESGKIHAVTLMATATR